MTCVSGNIGSVAYCAVRHHSRQSLLSLLRPLLLEHKGSRKESGNGGLGTVIRGYSLHPPPCDFTKPCVDDGEPELLWEFLRFALSTLSSARAAYFTGSCRRVGRARRHRETR